MKKEKPNTKTKERPLNNILGINIGLPSLSDTGVAVMNAENVITAYEKEALAILKRDGYPLTLEDLWIKKEEVLPDLANGKGLSRVYSIFWMLWNLARVRTYIEENNADMAVCFMATAVHWAIRAKLEPIVPFFNMGQNFSSEQKRKRGNRQKWNGQTKEQLVERNTKIFEHFKKAQVPASSFATKHASKYSLGSRQIRNIIKDMLGN